MLTLPMPEGWGHASLADAGSFQPRIGNLACSYDHSGRQMLWSPPASLGPSTFSGCPPHALRYACDIEAVSETASAMAARFELSDWQFVRRWVATEVLAKLFDYPILAWLQRYGLAKPDEVLPADVMVIVCVPPHRPFAYALGMRLRGPGGQLPSLGIRTLGEAF